MKLIVYLAWFLLITFMFLYPAKYGFNDWYLLTLFLFFIIVSIFFPIDKLIGVWGDISPARLFRRRRYIKT